MHCPNRAIVSALTAGLRWFIAASMWTINSLTNADSVALGQDTAGVREEGGMREDSVPGPRGRGWSGVLGRGPASPPCPRRRA